MAGLSSLPDELITFIFENCLIVRTQNPLSWLLTCRRLYHIAIPILYRHIFIRVPNAPKLLQPADGTRLRFTGCIFHRTRSLTVHVPFAQSFDKPRAWSEQFLQASKTVVSMMPSITSISFMSRPSRRPPGPARPLRLSQNAMADILAILPRTVTSLELSAPVIEPPWDQNRRQGPARICNALRNLIRQLHHLRLRVPRLCENQLSRFAQHTTGKPFPLRTAVIVLSTPRFKWEVRDPTAPVESLRIRRFHGNTKEMMRIRLSADARALCSSGRFPHLEEFIVLDALELNERTEIVVRADAVVGVTSAYPIQMLDGQAGELLAGIATFDMKYAMRVMDDHSSADGATCWKEYVGSYGELLSFMEGSATWTERPNGRQGPMDIDGGDEPLSMNRSIEEADSFQAHSELSCPMLCEPEMTIRPGRTRHIPCSVDLQEVFEDNPSDGYKIALTPEKAPDGELQAATG
ncbi:hypothetical protein BJX62DRAFT_236239 [Aspergillus germanicus]